MAGKKASISINVIADAARAKAGLAEAERAAGSLDAQFKSLAKTAVNAFATQQIIGFGKDAVGAASDLAESANAVAVTFGDAADGIMKLGEEASKAVGLSAKDFNAFAVQFAGFTNQLATSDKDIVAVTDELTTRIADFASVMNLDVPEAATKFRQALSGETEGMKQFGIDVSAAAVETYALANGITDNAKAMTEAEKVQARYGLVMEQTNKMSGDFANTSDGLANQQRILAAELENVKATVGQAMVPALQALMGAVGPVVEAFTALPASMQQAIVLTGAGAVGFRTLSNTMQGFGLAAGTANKATGVLAAGLAALTVILRDLGGEKGIAAEAASEYGAALKNTADDADRATRSMLEQKFLTKELGDALETLGLSHRTVTDAVLGDEAAQKKLTDTLDAHNKFQYGWTRDLAGWVGMNQDAEKAADLLRITYNELTDTAEATAREQERIADAQEHAARTSTYAAYAGDELNSVLREASAVSETFDFSYYVINRAVNNFGFSVKQAGYELDAFYERLTAEQELAKFQEDMDTLQSELAQLTEGTQAYNDKLREQALLVATLSEGAKKIPQSLEMNLVMGGDFDRLQRILDIAIRPQTYGATGPEEMGLIGQSISGALPSGYVGTQVIIGDINVNAGIGTDGAEVGRTIVETVTKYYASGGELIGTGPR